MLLLLHKLVIQLQSGDPPILHQWQQLLDGWIDTNGAEKRPISIQFSLQLAQTLPPLPASPPIFADTHKWPHGIGILTVYAMRPDHYLLHFQDGALVEVDVEKATVTGVVTKAALEYGRFQDITFTSLAPLLRRQGYYLVHGFAACRGEQAVLIVGPSGSGKTTSGLALVLGGWQLLANDMVLLEKRPNGIHALSMPDKITIRPETWKLLPALQPIVRQQPTGQKFLIPGDRFRGNSTIFNAPVVAIYFPTIKHEQKTAVSRQHRALALARLMEESIDQWDTPTLPAHLDILQTLSQQTTPYNLQLGFDVEQLPAILA